MFVQLKQAFNGKAVGEKIDVSNEHAELLIKGGIAEAVQGDPLGELVSKQVGGMLESLTKGINDTITDTLKEFAKAQTKSKKNAVPAIFGEGGEGDPKKNFGDFMLCIARKDVKRLEDVYGSHPVDEKGNVVQKAALAEGSGVTGGYTVPTQFHAQLLTIAAESAIVRQRAFVQPMASATMQFPYLDITTAQSSGVTPLFGGVQAYWSSEALTRTETEPTFKMMELKVNELTGYSISSNVLLADSAIGLEAFLKTLFGKAIGWYEDYAFIRGDGVGKPLGMFASDACIDVSRAGATAIAFADVATMWSKLLPASWGNAIWCFSPTCIPQLLQLKDGANRAIFISIDQGIVKTPTWSLLGRPAYPTEKLPALGTNGDLLLIDPSLYVIGDRQSLEIAASEHVNFLKNQMTWRFVERVDGQPWMKSAITLQDASTQVSPFVALN